MCIRSKLISRARREGLVPYLFPIVSLCGKLKSKTPAAKADFLSRPYVTAEAVTHKHSCIRYQRVPPHSVQTRSCLQEMREFCRAIVEAWENGLEIFAAEVAADQFAEH
jgi:hypothetical protein